MGGRNSQNISRLNDILQSFIIRPGAQRPSMAKNKIFLTFSIPNKTINSLTRLSPGLSSYSLVIKVINSTLLLLRKSIKNLPLILTKVNLPESPILSKKPLPIEPIKPKNNIPKLRASIQIGAEGSIESPPERKHNPHQLLGLLPSLRGQTYIRVSNKLPSQIRGRPALSDKQKPLSISLQKLIDQSP